ncbi:putative polyketide biosynthesis zinc-dependent hydrolase BaeB [Posidoniimonas polymericola]|uniref:Putative polyketide biosynthesis zinc-dependent hydrolase BaeB n=1 Tax=Posidoniimonas polymericola TaxID=2528002 RepID=A0A5C5YS73_9BACT|nr:MBL fold metallo-hydrolase [Posidoniimonas polymericola]TWT77738.1 putative polyketide biosynthesis zinc-dependent hydrolase BaeB [Posidoniimonas polymericola]
MLQRTPLFPNVIELNHQARQRITCSVYLIYDDQAWTLIDIGYEDAVDDCIELIRQLDFPFSRCATLIASHADVDHIQGLSKAKQLLKTTVTCHPVAASKLEIGDVISTFAKIDAQGIDLAMPPVKCENQVKDGDTIKVGGLELEVWHTPGHTDGQLSFRMGDLLFSGDNLFRDGCVGAIDAHHGSSIPSFISSLTRIRDSDVKWLLPSHGPVFRKENALIDKTIARLEGYLHMADFGTCAVDWPLMDVWERELSAGKNPE